MPKFMTQDFPKQVFCFGKINIWMSSVEGTAEHDNLSDPGIDLILTHSKEIVVLRIVWND